MDFSNFVKERYKDLHDAVKTSALQRLGRAMDRGKGLETLINNNDSSLDSFSSSSLARLADAHRDFLEWKDSAKSLRRSLAKNGLTLPDGSYDIAFTPGELKTLGRTAKICPRSSYADHSNWALAVKAHVRLWRDSVALSLAHGSAIVEMAAPEHPDAKAFQHLVTSRAILSEISGLSWFAIRTGTREEILKLTLELPQKEIQRQTEARLQELGLLAEKRGAESLVDELITSDLETTINSILDVRAEREAIETARSAYMDLLATPPLQVDIVFAAYEEQSSGDVGMAVLDKRGDIIEHNHVQKGDDAEVVARDLVRRYPPGAAVFSTSSTESDRLQLVEEAVRPIEVVKIDDSVIHDAIKNLSLNSAVAPAVVLGRRAIKPGREWGRVNPLSLDLGVLPKEIDTEKLGRILLETKQLSSWERRQRNPRRRRGASGRSAANKAVGRKLNTFVRTIRDLKPGLVLDGIITNITRFGAFVNIGLSTEGMIHVSQLSEEFVEDPSEVVRVGQKVKARVLEVVPEKERIALSLKSAKEQIDREKGPPVLDADGSKQKREPPKSRSAALADLDALFKK